jgi:hypothetical protein
MIASRRGCIDFLLSLPMDTGSYRNSTFETEFPEGGSS